MGGPEGRTKKNQEQNGARQVGEASWGRQGGVVFGQLAVQQSERVKVRPSTMAN